MNDDNLNYRFRLITFNDDLDPENSGIKNKVPSVQEEPKPPKYTLSSTHLNSDVPDPAPTATKPQPGRLSKSNTEIMAKKTSKIETSTKPCNTISVQDFNQMITSQDVMYPEKLIDCEQAITKDKSLKDKIKISRKKRKTQNNHNWLKDVNVIYTSETAKIPRRRKTYYQPPYRYAHQSNEFRDDFESLYKNEHYVQSMFKNNPLVYFQSSGDCRKGIFGKKKKSRGKDDACDSCEHFHVADMGDFCEDESPSTYNCTHLPHFNVVGFPQEHKTKFQLPLQDPLDKCGQSLTTVNFNDYESGGRFGAIRSQPCQAVSHTYECETGSKTNHENESKRAYKTVSEAIPVKNCERDPTAKSSCPKNTSEEKSKKSGAVDTQSKQTCACSVTMKSRSTTPKKTRAERSQSEPEPGNTKGGYFKYFVYGLAAIVFFPCLLIFSLCWLVTFPLRPRQAVPDLSKPSTQNNDDIRKPRERNLCHLNRAPKVLTNSIDNWCTIKNAVSCACKSALPSCQKTLPTRSCSPKPCSSKPCSPKPCSPRKCKKSVSSKTSCKKECKDDPCPMKIPSCAIKSYGLKHPDPTQQYRMFYGGALRGWLMKPLSCYGVTCKRKTRSYRNVCPTVMPVKTAGKKTSLTKQKKKGKTEKKAVKFATPMPNKAEEQRPVRKGEIRPCTDPRPSKKPCRVCCQPIRPDLDPNSVGLVHYGDGEKPGKKSKNPFKNKKKKKKKKAKPKKKPKPKPKKKPKKKKKKKKKKEDKGIIQSIKDAEQEAWGNESIQCDEIWVRTLRKKPCFWVYKRWPGLYPCFLQWHSCFTNCFSCCIMCLSTILWCPLLICVFICYKGICRK